MYNNFKHMSCNNNTLVISLIGQAIGQLRAGEYSLVVIPVYLLYKAIHVRTLAYYFTYYTTLMEVLRLFLRKKIRLKYSNTVECITTKPLNVACAKM